MAQKKNEDIDISNAPKPEKLHEPPKPYIILMIIIFGFSIFGYLVHSQTVAAENHPFQLSVSQIAVVEVYITSIFLYFVIKIRQHFFQKKNIYEQVATDTNLEFQDKKIDLTSFCGMHVKDIEQLLRAIIAYGTVLMFYVYTSSTGSMAAERHYDRDFFWGLMMMFLLTALLTIRKSEDKGCGVINRDQTEEWKGWMQIIFLSYHYFHAGKEIYNLIRVLIGAYVWMTGYGHFVYFYTKKRYDIIRVVRTLLRLNFLVIFTCFATDNEFMLYYICPMHTFWFFFVYFTMYIYRSHNHIPKVMALKFLCSFLFITILFESSTVFNIFFWPLKPLLSYSADGDRPLHEWYFRLGLDHYICWVGMICGYFRTTYQSKLDELEKKSTLQQWLIKGPITIGLLSATVVWFNQVFWNDKFVYNKLHPYWEFIPILTWLWCRNLTKTLRSYYLHMFSWWGRLTLESYISQLHILLTNNAKQMILLIPNYRVITMVIMSIFFGVCSKILFDGSVWFSVQLAPHATRSTGSRETNWGIPQNYIFTIKNFLLTFAVGSVFFTTSAGIHLIST